MKVMVYRNLHKKCWSIKNRSTGIVELHLDYVVIHNCNFKVGEKGRQRVLKEKCKNVHAGIHGNYDPDLQWEFSKDNLDLCERVYYNPYKNSTFVKADGSPIYCASEVILTNDSKVFAR